MMAQRGERVKELQNELMQTQTKTFTKWINSYLKKENLEVEDLFEDLSDGVNLSKLLEMLSGEKVGRINAGKTRFHKIENVNRCLAFLNSKVRLESIGAEDVVSGNPRLILGLLWTIIVNFQITQIFDTSSPDDERRRFTSSHRTAKEALLIWCQRRTAGYRGVKVQDFGPSWRDGLAFCALIHSERRDLIRFEQLDRRNRLDNLKAAFGIAESKLAIPKLLDAEDVDVDRPDEISIMTYLSQFYHAFNRSESSARILGKVDPNHPKMEIVEKPIVRPEVQSPPVIKVIPPQPARRTRLPSRDGLSPEVKSPETDLPRPSYSAPLENDVWACEHCPSVNLSTRSICGSCFHKRKVSRDRTANGRMDDDDDVIALRKRKSQFSSAHRFADTNYYVTEEFRTIRPTKATGEEEKQNKMAEEEVVKKKKMAEENAQPVKEVGMEALAAKVEKLEVDMERMKRQYYLHTGESESRSRALKDEVKWLREQLQDLGTGWESNKSKMARVERMLLNIASQKRTW